MRKSVRSTAKATTLVKTTKPLGAICLIRVIRVFRGSLFSGERKRDPRTKRITRKISLTAQLINQSTGEIVAIWVPQGRPVVAKP